MRRADRLFRIVQFLRVGRLSTARRLAEKLQVSERTIYRDVRDLQLSGMPIEGEAGIGYLLRQDFDIPPLMFTRSEIEALVLGARMVHAWGGAEQADAATQALHKIEAVLPPDLRDKVDQTLLYAPNFQVRAELKRSVDQLNAAASDRKLIEFSYTREDGEQSERRVRPLGLYFWGGVWTLASWCEMRKDFRNFRLDRMAELRVLEQPFPMDPDKSLQAFIAKKREDSSSKSGSARSRPDCRAGDC
jgi:predicted DNA-binding transcriptional regulator YafY